MGVSSRILEKFKNQSGGGNWLSDCPNGSRCCTLFDQQIWIKGTITGTIKDVRIQGWWSQPNVTFSFNIVANEHLVLGVCVKKSCPCPKFNGPVTTQYDFGTKDVGTITYPAAPFPEMPDPTK